MPLDPADIPDAGGIPVLFDFRVEHPLGRARVFHDDEGRLLFEAKLLAAHLLPGVISTASNLRALAPLAALGLVSGDPPSFVSVGLVHRNSNGNQPPYLIDEP